MPNLNGQTVLVLGGAGSLGSVLVDRMLKLQCPPDKIVVFSRDEAKHHAMRVRYQNAPVTDDVLYKDFEQIVQFKVGDVRDYHTVSQALRGVNIVFGASAIKQIPVVEYQPYEGLQTNVGGMYNVISAIIEHELPVRTVVGVSTDKACRPINAYGMTKALMERLVIAANVKCPETRFILTRYGNVMGSIGSVIPLFLYQKKMGVPLTITHTEMTRFMMNLDQAVNTLFVAVDFAHPGEIVVPIVPSSYVIDVAKAISNDQRIIGIRPGEKLHEELISPQEAPYVRREGFRHFMIRPQLPELFEGDLDYTMKPYDSSMSVMSRYETEKLLEKEGYI